MVCLFLSEPDWKDESFRGDNEVGRRWISLLRELEDVIWSLITANASGGRSEARLWLCNAIAGISSLSAYRQKELFVELLRTGKRKTDLASQLLHLLFDKRPNKSGEVLAKRSYILEKFFQGNPMRIMQWFSNFGGSGGGGGLEHNKGAKALSQFAFVNRNICWEELVWKGKHGQSPAMVATKPHYLLDLDIQRTVENFIENVPEFWSSSEFSETLKDGEILSIDANFFREFFLNLMYKEDTRDIWEVIYELLMEESFSSLCQRLLIALEDRELCTFLELLHEYLNPEKENNDFQSSSCWLEFVLRKYHASESIDQLLLMNAVINQGRQLLRLVRDEEFHDEQTKIKDIVSQISLISSSACSLVPMLNESWKKKNTDAIKFLGLQSFVLHYALSTECQSPESWESLFMNNGISFQKSDKYSLLYHDDLSDGNESDLDDRASAKRKHKKKKKSRKKRRRFEDDDSYEDELLDFATSKLDSQDRPGSWLLSTDGFSATWTSADLPEYLSKFCFSTWMKWTSAKWNHAA